MLHVALTGTDPDITNEDVIKHYVAAISDLCSGNLERTAAVFQGLENCFPDWTTSLTCINSRFKCYILWSFHFDNFHIVLCFKMRSVRFRICKHTLI